MTKTPKFDVALDTYFSKLELDENGGQWRVCRFSSEKFYVRPEDIAFYKKIRVPLPTLSPKERARRKLGYFNLYNLFHTKSALSGKSVIAAYPPSTPYPIYEHESWNGGGWDPEEFAVAHDPERRFFEQYKDFQRFVPRPNLLVRNSVNSDYAHNVFHVKDCYLAFDSVESENISYCIYAEYSKNCHRSFGAVKSDTCYDVTLSDNLYRVFFAEHSRSCLDSAFLYDCRDCQYCFASTNLRHKKYCFLNEQLTKDEYEKKIREVNLGDRNVVEAWKKKFTELKARSVHRAHHNERSVDCTGDYIRDSKIAILVSTLSQVKISHILSGVKKTEIAMIAWVETETNSRMRHGDLMHIIQSFLWMRACCVTANIAISARIAVIVLRASDLKTDRSVFSIRSIRRMNIGHWWMRSRRRCLPMGNTENSFLPHYAPCRITYPSRHRIKDMTMWRMHYDTDIMRRNCLKARNRRSGKRYAPMTCRRTSRM